MARALDVANYFLAALGADPESDLTNLKLQKLCAYAQAFSLALLGRPLFEERLEAWTHGPVVPTVYEAFKGNGRQVIPDNGMSEQYAREPFDDEQKLVLEIVAKEYGMISAWELRTRSHRDFPGLFGSKQAIPDGDIARQFATMPEIRALRDYVPAEEGGMLTEKEFWNAVSA